MVVVDSLNPLARRVWTALAAEYPQWAEYLSTCGETDLEVAVPAALGSKAGHLVVFTARGEDLWIRFSPPRMCYSIDDERELLAIIRQLQTDMTLFVVTMRGDEWVETTLIGPQDQPLLDSNHTAHVVSWSGKHDRTVMANMLPSFHDDYLVGYEVDCKTRLIKLSIKPSASDAERAAESTVVFTGVEGYRLENDAFENIILGLEVVTMSQFMSQYREEITESYRISGAPGTWASDLDVAPRILSERGIQAFVLSSSYGLSGWILAKQASIRPRHGHPPSDNTA